MVFRRPSIGNLLVNRGRLRGDRRLREGGLPQLNRMVQALSRSSQAMARARDEATYLDQVCHIVVEDCGCHLVWIGYRMQDEGKSVRPMAWAGFEEGYLSGLHITWADEERGRGPTGTAIRLGLPSLCRDMARDPRFQPWRREAQARGFSSSLALPLLNEGEAFGAITVYATEKGAFTDAQIRVLKELADDLAHGILTLRLRESERKAQEALRETSLRLQQLNDELERRVQERTEELVRANEALTARILELDRALEALGESEEKLRHVQKMQAIGTLAGGVAHDFNNLLQIINGYAELALEHPGLIPALRAALETILRAGRKGASLTRQLLAFSRKQVLAPEILDLNGLLRELEAFFQRVLVEDIQVRFDLEPGLGAVEADPSQLEQVIMNLVVNARDAMPGGGTLTLSTRNRGERVEFSVADTGEGMGPEVEARIFEPFFTTKEVGKGTGLGLSTALGIMEQSGGSLEVKSTPGAGTTFTASLPRVRSRAGQEAPALRAEPERGSGVVLLVEDNEGVRQLAAHHLEAAGYQVLEASDGRRALELLRDRKEPIQLLLTDVVMPAMAGGELADEVLARWPEVRVLFMSGYPDDAPALARGAWAGSMMIAKPFDRTRLLAMVRQALSPARG